jgi:V/A-type H+-transporting ATPase subunit D
MAKLRANPNRMELLRLKRRREVARRGHKLLKDKFDELLKEFLARITENRRLRAEVEAALVHSYDLFAVARAEAGRASLAQALLAGEPVEMLEIGERNVMSVRVPEFTRIELAEPSAYSLATTPVVIDEALGTLADVTPKLLELAQREKAIELLAAEIERTRRRVNALEYVLIPSIDETVKDIQMKLDEAERGNLTRLLKVKEIIAAQEERE